MKLCKDNKNIYLIGILNFLMEFKLYGAIAILYFQEISGSIIKSMSVFSIVMVASALLEIPTGILSDKIGRKKTILLGTIFSFFYIVFYAISNCYVMLIIGAIFEGLERALFSGNNEALLFDTLKAENKESEYGKYLGKTNSMFYCAGIISSILGTIIAFKTSYRLIMYLSIIPRIINIIIAIKIEEKGLYKQASTNILKDFVNSIKYMMSNYILRKQLIADTITDGVGEASFQARGEFYQLVWPQWALGIPNAIANIGSFLGNWFSDKIINKLGKNKVIIIGEMYSIISNVVAMLIKNIFSPIIIITNSFIPTGIPKEDISQQQYKEEYRSSMGSIKSFFKSISCAIFGIIIGILAENIGIVYTIASVQVFKLISIIIYLIIFKTIKKD